MKSRYDPVPSFPSPGSSSFISTDAMSRASLYWAEFLLSGFWADTTDRLYNISLKPDTPIAKGFVVLYPNQNRSRSITSLDFFDIKFDFMSIDKTTSLNASDWTPIYGGTADGSEELATVEYFTQLGPLPHLWKEVDLLAKSMYSAVVADLGLVSSSSNHNLATNATAVSDLLNQISSKGYGWEGWYEWYQVGINITNFGELFQNTQTGPLTLTPSVISTKYRCQVPQLKSGGEIFISILLADLVLLSAAWHLFTFLVNYFALRKLPDADHCEGCLRDGEGTIKEAKPPPKYARVATTSVSESRQTSDSPESDTDR